jgi:adenosylhomocysteine nucleosidase
MVAALFIHHFRPAEVIVTGTGSRFNPRIRTGDTVISTKTIHHAAGSLTDHGMVYRKVRGPLPGQMTHWAYPPDPRLLRLAKRAIPGYAAEPTCLGSRTRRLRTWRPS